MAEPVRQHKLSEYSTFCSVRIYRELWIERRRLPMLLAVNGLDGMGCCLVSGFRGEKTG
jgi:hypothetical protein